MTQIMILKRDTIKTLPLFHYCWRWVCAGGRGGLVHGTTGHPLDTKVCTIKL